MLSVRVTDEEFKTLHKTLRNFGIEQGSLSEQLRVFFKGAYLRSVSHYHRVKRKRERIQLERESETARFRESEQRIQEQKPEVDPEEAEQDEIWFNNLMRGVR